MSTMPDSGGFWKEWVGKLDLNLEALLGRIGISLEQEGVTEGP